MSGPVVLHVLEAIQTGCARHIIDLTTHATRARHHVVAPSAHRIGDDETLLPRLESVGAEVHLVEMHRPPWSPGNVAAVRGIRSLLRSVRPDVVHGHSSIGGALARMATSPRRQPIVYTAHGITDVRLGVAVERALGGRTSAFVAVSVSEAELAARLGLARRGEVVLIPNGLSLDAPPAPLDLRAELGLPEGTPLVGTIARLTPQKAPEEFVAACAEVARRRDDAHFLLVGEGELEDEVEAAIDEHGLRARLHRIKMLPGAAGVLGQLDVYAMSSRFEGGPYSPLEAMRVETPVVLTDVVGNRDVVEDGISGRLVPPGRPEVLGAAIADLLADPEERRRLGAGGRRRLVDRFDVRHMGAALDDLYERLRAAR